MNELELVLTGDSAATPPAQILEGLSAELAGRSFAGVPHTIYEELWHVTFWQEVSLDWIRGVETPIPEHAAAGFPSAAHVERETWGELCGRFLDTLEQAAAVARDPAQMERLIRCPSRPSLPVRVMSGREQIESLVAHNSYHFGRIVLLRQMGGAWPPPSGGFTW